MRNHPPITFRDLQNWPPLWVRLGRVGAAKPKTLRAEVGCLHRVRCYRDRPGRLYLTIDHDATIYVGCLLFDDHSFCERAFEHLRHCCGMEIETVGASNLP
jgi:hypothetical protein